MFFGVWFWCVHISRPQNVYLQNTPFFFPLFRASNYQQTSNHLSLNLWGWVCHGGSLQKLQCSLVVLPPTTRVFRNYRCQGMYYKHFCLFWELCFLACDHKHTKVPRATGCPQSDSVNWRDRPPVQPLAERGRPKDRPKFEI